MTPMKKEKRLRLNFLTTVVSDAARLAEALKARYQGATAIAVTDGGGLTFSYVPTVGGVTQRALAIPKTVVEDYNAALVAAAAAAQPPQDPPDLDTVEVMIGQLDHWIDLKLQADTTIFTDNDLIGFISASGTPDKGRFIYGFAKDSMLDTSIAPRQKHLITTRTDVAARITADHESTMEQQYTTVGKVVIVPSVLPADIITAIQTAIHNPVLSFETPDDQVYTAYEDPNLFAEDIMLPVTHFKDGSSYIAKVANTAFDFFGQVEFKIVLPPPAPPAGV